MIKFFRKDSAFTLVEILIVVIIIGILVLMAIPALNAIRRTTWTNTCKANISTLDNLSEAFNTSTGAYPVNQGALVPSYLKAQISCPSSHVVADYTIASGSWTCAQDAAHGNKHD